jgi:hypothetical protein
LQLLDSRIITTIIPHTDGCCSSFDAAAFEVTVAAKQRATLLVVLLLLLLLLFDIDTTESVHRVLVSLLAFPVSFTSCGGSFPVFLSCLHNFHF